MLRALTAVFRQLSLFDVPAVAPRPEPAPQPPDSGFPPEPAAPGIEGAFSVPDTASAPTVDRAPSSFADLCQGPYAHVSVEFSPRLRDSWKVSWTRNRESLLLRVPALLDQAPEDVKRAALRWAVLVSKRDYSRARGYSRSRGAGRAGKPDPALKAERRALEEAIRACLEKAGSDEAGPHRKRLLASNRRRLGRLNPRGACHDLEAILDAVNAKYFGGALEARITWASRLGGLSTHRLAEDGEGRPYHLLTISRGYDCPEVTPEILGGVVYHECLHIAIPPRKEGGRRVVHGRDFRLRERQYEHYQVWREWHRTGLPRALRRMLRAR